MAPIGKIYGYATHAKVARAVAAAKYNGVELEVVETRPMNGDCKKPEYSAKFPMAKIPAFEGTDGFKLSEGSAIARYVAGISDNAKLLGKDAHSVALVDQFISLADSEVLQNAYTIVFLCNGIIPYNKPTETKAWDGLHRALVVLESHLKNNTFLVGHRITLADLTLVSVINTVYSRVAGKEVQDKYPNIKRHFNTIVNQPTVSGVWGEIQFIPENIKFTPPKKESAPKAAKEQAPKKEKAAPKPKVVEKDDDEDDEPAPAPKAKNPLDELPKSSFNLEEFKRVYSNKDTPEALEWFFQNFDSEGFSVWRIDYKYNDELTLTFMSSNLISGLFTRFEASRKYVMGTAGVFGESNNSAIAGVIVLRGQDWKPVLSVAPDMDSYDVTPLDIKSPEGKKTFEDFLKWEAEVDGKKWADGKILK